MSFITLSVTGVACGPPTFPVPPPSFLAVQGTVVGVDDRTPAEEMTQGVRIRLRPEGSPAVVIDLAPGWYLNQQGLHFSEHERLSVEGTSTVGDPVVHAQRVSNGSVTVLLRDDQGRPYWDPDIVPDAP